MCYSFYVTDIERLELLTRQMQLEPAEDYQVDLLPPGSQDHKLGSAPPVL